MNIEDFYTTKEMAERLKIHHSTLRNKIARGDTTIPPFVRIGSIVRFPVDRYEAWKKAQRA